MAFIIILIGLALIVLNYRAVKVGSGSFHSTLSNAEKDMDDYDVKLGELRREFSETILELQKEIQAIKSSKGELVEEIEESEINPEEIEERVNLTNRNNKKADGRRFHNSLDKADAVKQKSEESVTIDNGSESDIASNLKSFGSKVIYKKDDSNIKGTNRDSVSAGRNESASNKENNTNNSVKINEISKLLSKGFTTEEVANKLGIGKGEVLLIKDLYLK